MALHVYNTLSRSKELFTPIDPALVRMYRCGPTVYKHMHIGHAKSYISFDVVRRYLMHVYGPEHVLFVMNITDVGHLANDGDEGEDKMEVQARRENRSPFEIARYYTDSWLEDLDRLNVLRPDRTPRATDFIRQQIELVENLIERGVAYAAPDGSVYFDVGEYERRGHKDGCISYGALSNRRTEEGQEGYRIERNESKRDPRDFALWKSADEHHFMQWLSPWGWGYPGWHLECSVMAQFYLGRTFDIHAGGLDNMFPHHECEIAQSQAANDAPFVRYWMHNNFLNIRGSKMGASLGNSADVKSLVERFDPMAIRFFILQSQYRSPLDFDEESLGAAAAGLDKLRGTVRRLSEAVGSERGENGSAEMPEYMTRFFAAMDDDINTPVALAALFEGVGEVNRLLAAGAEPTALVRHRDALRLAFEDLLGLSLFEQRESGSHIRALADELVGSLLSLRTEARARKDFATADAIRDRLSTLGVTVEDGKDGTRWNLGG